MRVARIEQVSIGKHNARRDLGKVPATFAVLGAGSDDRFEVAVKRDRVVVLAHLSTQSLCDVYFVKEKNRVQGRRPPFQWRNISRTGRVRGDMR